MNREQNLPPTKWPPALVVVILIVMDSVFATGQAERVIYRFEGGSDGLDPLGSLISDDAGNFYGTTCGDGAANSGTVFQLVRQGGHWTENVLYSFAGSSDGNCPFGELILDRAGNLYGTAASVGGFALRFSN